MKVPYLLAFAATSNSNSVGMSRRTFHAGSLKRKLYLSTCISKPTDAQQDELDLPSDPKRPPNDGWAQIVKQTAAEGAGFHPGEEISQWAFMVLSPPVTIIRFIDRGNWVQGPRRGELTQVVARTRFLFMLLKKAIFHSGLANQVRQQSGVKALVGSSDNLITQLLPAMSSCPCEQVSHLYSSPMTPTPCMMLLSVRFGESITIYSSPWMVFASLTSPIMHLGAIKEASRLQIS
ncbi:hypothetical protein SeLEV6574_g02271 [Synchytrium endobioticum]|uniref:Uncharacterized protein n=1 Tax=Synchytrium endobioticum TaxID=286115 RepID=A0A507D8U1_9FUNG|nr:hypothetical protein SeLEV6574_g02271 [Synchytrium endobioticum]